VHAPPWPARPGTSSCCPVFLGRLAGAAAPSALCPLPLLARQPLQPPSPLLSPHPQRRGLPAWQPCVVFSSTHILPSAVPLWLLPCTCCFDRQGATANQRTAPTPCILSHQLPAAIPHPHSALCAFFFCPTVSWRQFCWLLCLSTPSPRGLHCWHVLPCSFSLLI
jgi:hypothetical protein